MSSKGRLVEGAIQGCPNSASLAYRGINTMERLRLVGGLSSGTQLRFFFQAEDGIRHFHVTGVQTCALPIPIQRPGKIVCVGLNYRDHAEEQGVDLPKAPLFFAKYTTSLVGPGDAIVIPSSVEQADYEAELGVVIGTTVRNVSKENAMEAVAGYVVANDVSARDLQF